MVTREELFKKAVELIAKGMTKEEFSQFDNHLDNDADGDFMNEVAKKCMEIDPQKFVK